MIKLSRRQLAKYAVDELLNKQQPSVLAASLAAVLIVQKRLGESELLLADSNRELEDRGLLAQARITSAHPLNAQQLKELTDQIKKLTQVEAVNTQTRVDKQMLGGFKIETANHSWDKTVRYQLNQVRESV